MSIIDRSLPIVGRIAQAWDDRRYRLKLRLGLTSPPILLPYRGYCTKGTITFGGRVIENERIVGARPTTSRWKNLWRTFRRYETDEIRNARVSWAVCGQTGVATTDAQGFFEVTVPCGPDRPSGPWETVQLTLESAAGYAFEALEVQGAIRIVSPDAAFGVISDIDDTIVQTGAQHLLKHWRTVALNSAEGRVAFPGVAHFYGALAEGRSGRDTNPIFYVSSSPWNLYDLFDDFLKLCAIPHGPMFLKDFGLDATQWLTGSHAKHKIGAIERLLEAYPNLRFVLIGDTGQSDATIYAQIVRQHPDRIVSVHLRDVTPKGFKPRVRRALAEIEGLGVPVTSGPTLDEAARTAESLGLVEPGTTDTMVEAVRKDRQRLVDRKGPMPFRKFLNLAVRGSRSARD